MRRFIVGVYIELCSLVGNGTMSLHIGDRMHAKVHSRTYTYRLMVYAYSAKV